MNYRMNWVTFEGKVKKFYVFVMYSADIVAMIETTVLIFSFRLKTGGRQVTEKPFTSK